MPYYQEMGINVNKYEAYEKEIDYLMSIFNMVVNKWSGLKPKSVKRILIALELKDGMRLHKEKIYEDGENENL